jgi:hypothetical protein
MSLHVNFANTTFSPARLAKQAWERIANRQSAAGKIHPQRREGLGTGFGIR